MTGRYTRAHAHITLRNTAVIQHRHPFPAGVYLCARPHLRVPNSVAYVICCVLCVLQTPRPTPHRPPRHSPPPLLLLVLVANVSQASKRLFQPRGDRTGYRDMGGEKDSEEGRKMYMKTNRCTLHFVWMAQASNSVLTLHSGGLLAVLESPLASLGRGSLVLTRHLGWEADWGGGGASGWGAAGGRLRFFFFFGAVLALLLDDEDDCEAVRAPPADPYPSQSG